MPPDSRDFCRRPKDSNRTSLDEQISCELTNAFNNNNILGYQHCGEGRPMKQLAEREGVSCDE